MLVAVNPSQPAQRKTRALQRLASGDKAPECDEQFARECDDHRFAGAGTAIGRAGLVPSRQCAVLLKPQKAPGEWDHPAADPGIARLWRALVPAAWRRSRPAHPSGRRSAPPLGGHAWAATAPHWRAYRPFQCRCRQPEPAVEPWRVACFQAPLLIAVDEPPRFA